MRQPALRTWGLSALALLLLILGSGAALAFEPSGLLEIHYVNVQQGGSILVIGPDGTTVLMDAGRGGKGIGEVVPYLMSIGLTPADGLDYTLAGHLDSDHVGGFAEIFAAGYDVRRENWFNGSGKSNPTVDAYRAAATLTTAGLPEAIHLGHVIELGDGARMTVVAVAGEILGGGSVPAAAGNENDLSVAVLVEYGNFDYLWAGDLGGGDDDTACTGRSTDQADVETPLARALTPGGAAPMLSLHGVDVLHVDHHGSESSTNSTWMNLLRPEVAVISVGAGQGGNFEHPRRAVVEGVLLRGAPCITAPAAHLVLQTEEGSPSGPDTSFAGYAVGDVRITTGGASYRVEATGAVSQGPDERAAAGLPRTFPVDEGSGDGLDFLDGRFHVTVDWQRRDGTAGHGHPVPFTDRAGLFWFFNQENLEMLVKMVDACSFNDRFWLFFAATTNVGFTVTVVDDETSESKVYTNAPGHPADPVLDTAAFATCGGPGGPVADFTWSCRGFRCQFQDLSTPPPDGFVVGRRWDFGDGSSSIVSAPLHRYFAAGTKTVQLEVEGSGGGSDAVVKQVDVSCIPRSACCKVCSASKACGDSCISSGFSCSQGVGCACNDEEVC